MMEGFVNAVMWYPPWRRALCWMGWFPEQDRCSGQCIHVVAIQAHVHLVPFAIQPNDTRLLKTIIPSRKATREYSRRQP